MIHFRQNNGRIEAYAIRADTHSASPTKTGDLCGCMTKKQLLLVENVRRMGFKADQRVSLYGHTYDLISEPILVRDLVLIDAIDCVTRELRRIRLPEQLVRRAKNGVDGGTGRFKQLPQVRRMA